MRITPSSALRSEPAVGDPLWMFREGESVRELVFDAGARTIADIMMVFNSPDSPYRQGMARNELLIENIRQVLTSIDWAHFHHDNQARFASPDAHAPHLAQVIVASGSRAEGCFVFRNKKGPATRRFVRLDENATLPGVFCDEPAVAQPLVLIIAKETIGFGSEKRRVLRIYAVHARGLSADGRYLYYHDFIDLGVLDPSNVREPQLEVPQPVPVKPTLWDARGQQEGPGTGAGL